METETEMRYTVITKSAGGPLDVGGLVVRNELREA